MVGYRYGRGKRPSEREKGQALISLRSRNIITLHWFATASLRRNPIIIIINFVILIVQVKLNRTTIRL